MRYEFADVDLSACVAHLVKSHEFSAHEKGIAIAVDGESELVIKADANRINQLLTNLIRNSLAYTDVPGHLTFNLQVKNGSAQLSISDTPPGVTMEECSQLFEPLFRQDASRTRRGEGAGLGLAICQNIVEAHRGTIVAQPSVEGGLQIVIKLPLAKRQEKI